MMGTETQIQAQETGTYALPSSMYGRFFYDVMGCDSLFMEGGLFPECKTFVDIEPKEDIYTILKAYSILPQKKSASLLSRFICNYFTIPTDFSSRDYGQQDIDSHINTLWSSLQRQPGTISGGTFIALKHPYFIPGGRFREIYYWDSYFSMLGMYCDHQYELLQNMLDNFSDLINTVGFIPNGNRTYYLGRSQAPYFCQMVSLLAKAKDSHVYITYLPEMQKEYDFWMKGKDSLSKYKPAVLRTVLMPDGTVLNRYYDNFDTPRDEMYRNDVETGKQLLASNPFMDLHRLYRNLRASAESGFDFSSRWMVNDKDLYTTHTIDIVPVDLNTLMYIMEKTLAKSYRLNNDYSAFEKYERLAARRRSAIEKYFWDKNKNYYFDYVWTDGKLSPYYNLAGVFPLFGNISSRKRAQNVSITIERNFLKPGGLLTSPYHTGQQWDAPNGWAPLQWITYCGLRNYKLDMMADTVRRRWMSSVEQVYHRYGKLLEKYNVEKISNTDGGEYPNQEGFGWTNGVYRAMKCKLK